MNVNTKSRVILSLLCAAIVCVVLTSPISAQNAFSRDLDLETAIAKAMGSDPRVRTSQTQRKIAEYQIVGALSGRYPTVISRQTFTRSNNPASVFGILLEQGRFTPAHFSLDSLNRPSGINNVRTSVLIEAPILDQRQTRSHINQGRIEKSTADLQADAVTQKVRFEVIRTYFGALLADELLKAADASVRSARENSRKTQDFVNVGLAAESDSLVANVELANVEQKRLEAQSSVVTTRAALNIAMGEGPTTRFSLRGNLQERHFPIDELPDLLRTALDERPDYKCSFLAIEDSREKTRSIRDQKLPRLVAFGSFGYSSPHIVNGSSDYTVGLSLAYTLFDPGRKARIEQSILLENKSASERDRLKDQITLEVITADQNYRTARAKIVVSIKSVIQAEEALRILQDRYRAAISTFEAVLGAEAALLRARHELLKAKYDYYVSYASLLLATGRLTDARPFVH